MATKTNYLRKYVAILLTVLLTFVMAVPANAAETTPSAYDSATYYFLAPDNYFKTNSGAVNTDVGYICWSTSGNPNAKWPGVTQVSGGGAGAGGGVPRAPPCDPASPLRRLCRRCTAMLSASTWSRP